MQRRSIHDRSADWEHCERSLPIRFMPTIARQLGVSYNAAKNNLKRLAEEGILKEDRFKGRKFWIAQDVLDVTTDDEGEA